MKMKQINSRADNSLECVLSNVSFSTKSNDV